MPIDITGKYFRLPIETFHHEVTITRQDPQTWHWTHGGGSGWALTEIDGDEFTLTVSEDCPQLSSNSKRGKTEGDDAEADAATEAEAATESTQNVTIEMEGDTLVGLRFMGDLYEKQDDDAVEPVSLMFRTSQPQFDFDSLKIGAQGDDDDDDDDSGGAVIENDELSTDGI